MIINNFAKYITPKEAMFKHNEINPQYNLPLSYWEERAKIKNKCSVCEQEEIWRFGQTDMCFSCMTGESDASNDYEIIYQE